MKQDLLYFLPELVLALTILVSIAADFMIGHRQKRVFPLLAIVGLLAMMYATCSIKSLPPAHFFSGMVTYDAMGSFFKYVFGASGLLAIVLSFKSQEIEKVDQGSYYTLLIGVVFGMCLLSVSNHLLMLYLSLEIVSIFSYLLTASVRGVRKSSEAALKYVIYGGAASGIMAYGFSLLYGMTGSLYLPEIASFLTNNAISRPVLFLSALMIIAGLAFKVAAFPFHMWSPDVYEGAPTPFTAFLSVGPKAAGFAIIVRFFLTALTTQQIDGSFLELKSAGWPQIISILAIGSMFVGNLAALAQKNMKRLLAYSSVAHAGYMLMGFAALNQESLSSILLYVVVYTIMNMGAFLVVIVIQNQFGVDDIEGYRGLGRRGGLGAFLGVTMAIFMFSLTGLPPLAGFIGKFFLFGAVVKAGLYTLAIIGVLNSVISLYYYVYVVKVMFFDEPLDSRVMVKPFLGYTVVLTLLAGLTVYYGLFWNCLAQWTQKSATLLF